MSVPYNGDWTVQQHPYSTIKPFDLLYDKLYRPPTSSMGVESRVHQGPLHHAPPDFIYFLCTSVFHYVVNLSKHTLECRQYLARTDLGTDGSHLAPAIHQYW